MEAPDNTEYLKNIYKFIDDLLEVGTYETIQHVKKFVSCFADVKSDTSSQRIIIDALKQCKDIPEIKEEFDKMVFIVESKIGKLH